MRINSNLLIINLLINEININIILYIDFDIIIVPNTKTKLRTKYEISNFNTILIKAK